MRKISVSGKGGSGKSTVVTLLASEARERGYRVLVVDSDESNPGLPRMLGFDRAPLAVMELLGGRRGLKQKMNSPSGEILSQKEILVEDISAQHMLERDGLRLVATGKIVQSLEGCACPMGVLTREFLKKLRLEADEIAIVDMEAGVEHFGRGVDTSIDSVLIVVDPSFDSLQLAEKVNSLAAGMGIDNVWAVVNKAPTPELALKVSEELRKRGVEVAGIIHHDPEIFEACLEGRALVKGRAAEDVGKILDSLLSRMQDRA
jgi:CO dehydrogenase maturation factor